MMHEAYSSSKKRVIMERENSTNTRVELRAFRRQHDRNWPKSGKAEAHLAGAGRGYRGLFGV